MHARTAFSEAERAPLRSDAQERGPSAQGRTDDQANLLAEAPHWT